MNIFLTGATGFLGSHTAEELVTRGHHVSALFRSKKKTQPFNSLPIQWIEGSLPECDSLESNLEGTDVIIHIAGVVKAFSEKDFLRVNALGTKSLVEKILALQKKPKLFIHVSTIAVHNPGQDGPDFCLTPEKCHPLTRYGRSKLEGEKMLDPLRGKMRVIILRPPVLYGPRDLELLPLFKAACFGAIPLYKSGNHELSLCYASDVAKAIANLAENPPPQDEIFCLDDGEVHTWKSLAQTLSTMAGKKSFLLPIPHPLFKMAAGISQAYASLIRRPAVFTLDKMKEIEQPRWVCGYENLNRKTGWKPQVNLREGIKKTFEFYKDEKR